MTAYRNAFSLPGDRVNRRVTRFGLYGADGLLLPHAQIDTTPWQAQPAPQARPAHDSSRLFGPALFAGPVDKQFGFILLNALGRLPALDGLPPQTTLVYAAKPTVRVPDYAVLSPVLRSLAVNNPVLVTENPLHFQELYTAPELFGESLGGTGQQIFYDWIDRRWPAPGAPDPESRLYVTRSGLGPKAGRFACEDHLERLLQGEGYQIFAPEAHPIDVQVRAFQAAGKLIFAESSALHLFALLRQPGQTSAVIHRRPTLPAVMQAQMADRQGQPTVAINAVTELWWPPQRGDHLGLSVLDFHRLRDALQAGGLITGQGWTVPDAEAVAASLRAGLEPGQDVMTTEHRAEWLRAKREKKG